MKWIDLHCDALMKLALHPEMSFYDDSRLDTNYLNLKKGNVRAQAFAIFVHPDDPVETQYETALKQVECFYTRVLTTPGMKHLKTWEDFLVEDEYIGAFLTLEGVGPIGNDLHKLDDLIKQGVLSVGLTWNPANLAADGIGETRNAGLSKFGFEIVEYLNKHRILCDVSHLSHQSFEDVLDHADFVLASHSNCYRLCPHPRNLTDHQIMRMIDKKAMIHLVLNPPFVATKDSAQIADLLPHIRHLHDLGANHLIGMGSDFDGITEKLVNLENWSKGDSFEELLLNELTIEDIQSVQSTNFLNYIRRLL